MIKPREESGFSLVELMVVVAIMAILAAIAIPNFLRFSMKAKTSEATENLAAIRVAQESYRSENDVYLACTASPTGGGTDATADAWNDNGGFGVIGFEPDGNVRYLYAVAVTAPAAGVAPTFSATATGDLDENGTAAVYTVDTTAAIYPKPVRLPPNEY
jgi:type IV pilus assembly protein PilA